MYQKLHEASDYVNESDDSMMQKKVMQTRHPNFHSLHFLFIEPRNQFCSKMFVPPCRAFLGKKVPPYFVMGRGDSMLYLHIFSHF